jgi:hypothetical protein
MAYSTKGKETMNGTSTAKQNIDISHQILESTMADVTDDILHEPIPGLAHPIGASYAHTLISEDMIVGGMLRGAAPLFASSWAERTGCSQMMPMPGPDWVKYDDWVDNVRIDLTALREYGKAVYAQTDAYVGSLSDDDLDREVDMTAAGLGKVNVAFVLNGLIAGHASQLTGEIAAAKGNLGRKGYPF